MDTIKILGTKISILTKEQIVDNVLAYLRGSEARQIVTPNPEFLLEALLDEEFAVVLNQADLAVPDGFGLVITAACKAKKLERLSGADLVPIILTASEKNNLKVAIINWSDSLSDEKVITKVFNKKYPKLNFKIWSIDRGDDLKSSFYDWQAEVVLVALGAPWQDILAAKLKANGNGLKLAIGVGGSLDFLTGQVRRAPKLMRAIGLEWLWRLIINPSVRSKRIFNAVIKFPLIFVRHDIINRFFYRPSVVGFIYNSHREVLIVNSNKEPGRDFWKLPQGGRNYGESDEQALKREMLEELGTTDFNIIRVYPKIYKYLWPKGYSLEGYKGQRQSLFILEYTGKRQDIYLSAENKAYKWVPINELLKATDSVVHQAYELYLEKYQETLK